jgi:hypothetical protein
MQAIYPFLRVYNFLSSPNSFGTAQILQKSEKLEYFPFTSSSIFFESFLNNVLSSLTISQFVQTMLHIYIATPSSNLFAAISPLILGLLFENDSKIESDNLNFDVILPQTLFRQFFASFFTDQQSSESIISNAFSLLHKFADSDFSDYSLLPFPRNMSVEESLRIHFRHLLSIIIRLSSSAHFFLSFMEKFKELQLRFESKTIIFQLFYKMRTAAQNAQ